MEGSAYYNTSIGEPIDSAQSAYRENLGGPASPRSSMSSRSSGSTTPTPQNPYPEKKERSFFFTEFHSTASETQQSTSQVPPRPQTRRGHYSLQADQDHKHTSVELISRQAGLSTHEAKFQTPKPEQRSTHQWALWNQRVDRKIEYTREYIALYMAAPASPSQRLPSPPPFPEVQIGPKSPGTNPSVPSLEAEDAAKYHQQATRRIRPGTKAADMVAGLPLVPLSQLDSPYQLQEHLKALFSHHTRSLINPKTTVALNHDTALQIVTPPEGVDKFLWLYELCRLCVIKANTLIVAFFSEHPPCSAETCPEMRASEWQYLCAVHEPPKPCCAIDYCCHTLDWAANTLTSQKNFPSRLTLGNEASGGSVAAIKNLTNIMRRVYRIFAHAWFQHRSVFWQVEGQEGLYILFKKICDLYVLIPEENYTIPPEAEGLPAKGEEPKEGKAVLKKPQQADEANTANEDAETTTSISTGATTRRHKHTPSVGSMVTPIQEGDEEEDNSNVPTKEEKPSGPLDTFSSSMMKEAPLAQISKTAEKKEESPVPAGTKTAEKLPEEAMLPSDSEKGEQNDGDGHIDDTQSEVSEAASTVTVIPVEAERTGEAADAEEEIATDAADTKEEAHKETEKEG